MYSLGPVGGSAGGHDVEDASDTQPLELLDAFHVGQHTAVAQSGTEVPVPQKLFGHRASYRATMGQPNGTH